MNFAGVNLDQYMKGNSFGTEQQNALQNAAGMADRLSLQTFGNTARTRIRNDSALNMAKAEKKLGGQIAGIMGPAQTLGQVADIGTTLMSTDFSSMFGGGGFSNNGDPGTFGTSLGVGQTNYSWDAPASQYAPGSISSPGWTWANSGIG